MSRKNKEKGAFGKILLALGIGAAAGATVVYASDPKNRKKIKATEQKVVNRVKRVGKTASNESKCLAKSTAKSAKKVAKSAKSTKK